MAKKLFVRAKTKTGLNSAVTAGTLNAEVAFIEEPGNEGIYAKGKTYQTIPSGGAEGQILVSKGGKGKWADMNLLDMVTYGVAWKPGVADVTLTRVGNMSYHRTLPIQSGMKGCVYNSLTKKIVYWLNHNDWRLKEFPTETTLAGGSSVVNEISEDAPKNTVHATNSASSESVYHTVKYFAIEDSTYSKVIFSQEAVSGGGSCTFYIVLQSTDVPLEYAKTLIESHYNSTTGIYENIEVGSCLDGQDGDVMVYVPEFWIKSWDEPDKREVRISPIEIDETWEHQPAVLVSAYKATLYNPNNDTNTDTSAYNYLASLQQNTAVSVESKEKICRGGDNHSTYDQYISSDPFRSYLGKPRTSIDRKTFRNYVRKSGNEIMSYKQYKNIICWLMVIEYATFGYKAPVIPSLTPEGFHQGGLGPGIVDLNILSNGYLGGGFPITPNGYTNNLGNNSGVRNLVIPEHTPPLNSTTIPAQTRQAIRYRGIENPYSDSWDGLDGFLILPNSTTNSKAYATDDPTKYTDYDIVEGDLSNLNLVADAITNQSGTIKEFALGSTAEIFARSVVDTPSIYKGVYQYGHTNNYYKTPSFGGSWGNGSASVGFGCNYQFIASGSTNSDIGYRITCLAPKSVFPSTPPPPDLIEWEPSGVSIVLKNGDKIDMNNPAIGSSYSLDEVEGIGIEDEYVSLLMSPGALLNNDSKPQCYFSNGTMPSPTGIEVEPSVSIATNKFNGQENTEIFATHGLLNDQNWAIALAYRTTLNGKRCWLPSFGELYRIFGIPKTKEKVMKAIEKCGGVKPTQWLWSSSLISKTTEGYISYLCGYNAGTDDYDGINCQGLYQAVAVTSL